MMTRSEQTRALLERYVAVMFAVGEAAEMTDDVETWEYAQYSESDGRTALALLDCGRWYSGDTSP